MSLVRFGGRAGAAVVGGTAWAVLLTGVTLIGGWSALGAVLGVSYAVQVAPSLWTAWRVADLIERECRVRYHPGHVWWLLRKLGWSCQRPTGRAVERDEAAIAHWKRYRWPTVKTTPRASGKRSSSSTKAG